MLPLPEGSIVTDIDEESRYEGEQGIVLGIQTDFWEPDEVLVRMTRLRGDIYNRDNDPDWIDFVYEERHLRVDPDWTPQVYANRFFKGRWNFVSSLRFPLDQSRACMVEDCPHKQEHRIWFNCWGTVCNAYVCETCAQKYHACCIDMFPYRRKKVA